MTTRNKLRNCFDVTILNFVFLVQTSTMRDAISPKIYVDSKLNIQLNEKLIENTNLLLLDCLSSRLGQAKMKAPSCSRS